MQYKLNIKSSLLLISMLLINFSTFSKPKNGEWVIVRGKVSHAAPDYFILDKGYKKVLVEMDDWDWFKEGYKILKGDRVIVQGKIDHDFLERRKIEASSVYVQGLNTYYYASSDDEETEPYHHHYFFETYEIPDEIKYDFTGTISRIDDREFVLNTGLREVSVDTEDMKYNPMDDKGLTQLKVGDAVRVYGDIENNFFTDDVLNANWIITLKKQ